jgi:hypothetical protein
MRKSPVRGLSIHGTAGPHWGHIRATDDQIAADNNGHHRTAIGPAQQASLLPTAGPRNSPALPDTDELTALPRRLRRLANEAAGHRGRLSSTAQDADPMPPRVSHVGPRRSCPSPCLSMGRAGPRATGELWFITDNRGK